MLKALCYLKKCRLGVRRFCLYPQDHICKGNVYIVLTEKVHRAQIPMLVHVVSRVSFRRGAPNMFLLGHAVQVNHVGPRNGVLVRSSMSTNDIKNLRRDTTNPQRASPRHAVHYSFNKKPTFVCPLHTLLQESTRRGAPVRLS